MNANNKGEETNANSIPLHAMILEDRTRQGEKISSLIGESLESVSKQTGIRYSLSKVDLMDNPEEVYKILNQDDSLPDWVFCDLDLKVVGAGKEVAERISNELYPTDVLLYTYAGMISNPDPLPKNRYGATLMANKDQIEGKVVWLMWRTLVKLSDPEYTRGLLLSRAADTESLLDECLSYLFRIQESQTVSFKWGLLRGEGYNWRHKFDVLSSGLSSDAKNKLEEKGIKMVRVSGHLNGIFQFRNDIAHGIVKGDQGGGLFLKNRISSNNTADSDQFHKTRDQIKKQLCLCHNTERDISSILSILKEDVNMS